MEKAFTVHAADPASKARLGALCTAHGEVETPVFMPVGTQGTVKAMMPEELERLGARVVLGNTYHLAVRPGMDVIREMGGLHRFMNWDKPILTDSGGYQVFSLARLRKITPEGVHFQNHIDGSPMTLGPESAMEIQAALGSDIAMIFDECPPYPCEREYARKSLDLTLAWARRCREWVDRNQPRSGDGRQLQFGIVQGAVYADLREECARALVEMDWDGYAVGGVSVGEPEDEMMRAVENAEPFLPADKPRYAMGLGTPPQMIEMVARGIDMFDCVLPTRLARNGTAFTAGGTLNLKNNKFRLDPGPIEDGCGCPACRGFSRAYLRHLIKAEEILGLRLISVHNLHFYLDLMARARAALRDGAFASLRQEVTETYQKRPT